MKIVVIGIPAPQGSKKFVGMRDGHAVLVESSKKVGPWRKAVMRAATAALGDNGATLYGPLRVWMLFLLPRPKDHYRTGQYAGQLRPDAPARPDVYPDVSKLARSTEDALTNAGVWHDDAQVVEYSLLSKEYADSRRPPGATITIEKIESMPQETLALTYAEENG